MANYTLEGQKWGAPTLGTPGGTVTWAFDSSVPASFQGAFATSFGDWSSQGNIQFQQLATGSNANIIVNYANIDGAGNAAGVTNYSFAGSTFLNATITIDSSEGWHVSGSDVVSSGNFPLKLIAAHEEGHAIGLGHYEGEPAVMNATIPFNLNGLQPSDIAGVRAIYGTACYVTGTRILTTAGSVAVEDLCVGDLAVTASGEHRPIRWIGHRTLDCCAHPNPSEVLPVRIAAGALGDNRPSRDLLASPGHTVCLDVLGEVLIPVVALVNGTTIRQEKVETVTYWHVELDSHDILIAEGQPAESYLDMGNRVFFAESPVVDLGAGPDGAHRTHADFCRPFHGEGVLVEAVGAQLRRRAETLGWRFADEPWGGMHLMVDGERIDADTLGLAARFVLPPSAREIWLVSETAIPREIGLNGDPRRLGLCLRSITLDDGIGERRSIALDDPRLSEGFYDHENGERLWTDGRARLPSALFEGLKGTVFLRIELTGPALPRWVAPGDETAEQPLGRRPLAA